MKRIIFISIIVLMAFASANAQSLPMYSQYIANPVNINPAYAGSKDNLSLGLLHREQWIELEDAPVTSTFFGHSPVGKNVGLGLSVVSDKLGPVEENNIYGDFSYTLKLGGDHKLALGLKAGLTLHNVDYLTKISPSLPDAAMVLLVPTRVIVILILVQGLFIIRTSII